MTGAIAGIYCRDGRLPSRQSLDDMLSRLAYRAVGNAGLWRGSSAAVAALNSTLMAQDSTCTAVADARLDNREELISRLGLGGAADDWREAALILAAYQRWGEDTPKQLLGDFAFVVWDSRRQTMFCARDHFGIKQLYFYNSPHFFAFATEIKALLALPEVPRQVNEARLAELLLSRIDDDEATLYNGIFRLPPASNLQIGPAKTTTRRYWQLDQEREIHLSSDREYAEQYRDLLTEAVRCRLRGPGLPGATVSGGLDSSSIACVARDILVADDTAPLHTFSAVYDEVPVCDERPYIESVLAAGNVVPHFIHPEQHGPLGTWQYSTLYEDEPLWAPQLPITSSLYQAAGQSGVGMLLEGLGGDQVVGSGWRYLDELAAKRQPVQLIWETLWTGHRYGFNPLRLLRRVGAPMVPAALKSRRTQGSVASAPTQTITLQPEFVRRLESCGAWQYEDATARTVPKSLREDQYRSLTSPTVASVYLAYKDRVAAAAGVEPRYPFFDRRLIEFCLALPPEQKQRRGWTRWVARNALGGILPEKVRWRAGKTDLAAAFNYGLLTHDRATLDSILLDEPGPLADYIAMPQIADRYRRFLAHNSQEDALPLWQVASMGLWLRRFCAQSLHAIQ